MAQIKALSTIRTPKEAYQAIMDLFAQYRWTRKQERLEDIQLIVDRIGRPFELKIEQPDGIPGKLRFEPRGPASMLLSK